MFANLDKEIEGKLLVNNNETNSYLSPENSLFEANGDFKNKFYFENLTDDCFFDKSGAKDEFVRFYKRITKTGVSTIIFGGINLLKNSKEHNNLARISIDENIISSYKSIAFFAHSVKSKIILKVNAGIGRFYNCDKKIISKYGSNFCLDPENKQKLVIRANDNKCNEIINEILKIMLLAKISKLDGVMIDASYLNLIGELSSQEFNKRIFGYYSNTNDFLTKLLKSTNKNEMKIYLKINILSLFLENKNDIELCKLNPNINEEKIFNDLKTYIELGVSGFEFVFGRLENKFLSEFSSFQDELLFESFVQKFRTYLNDNHIKNYEGEDVLIFYHDNFSNFEKISKLCKDKIVDLVNVTRDLYSDFNFLNQTKNAKQVKKCLKCSFCNKIAKENQKVECLINPKLCDFEQPLITSKAKDVAVIGSGISGLICAKTLAERGYNVSIFEQENIINPIGKLTTIFGFNKSLNNYFQSIESDINNFVKNNKIKICLNEKFLPIKENIKNFHSIIIATGFKPKFLAVSGAVQPHVINLYDALKKEKILLSKKHIVIYAKSTLSLNLALYLALQNIKVTLIIKDIKLFNLEKNANLFYFFNILIKNNVNIYLLSRVVQINEDNIDVIVNNNIKPNNLKNILSVFSNCKIKTENRLVNLDCNLFIYEPETIPNNSLYAEIVSSGYKGEMYLIGNALENSDLAENIKSGYFVGKNL